MNNEYYRPCSGESRKIGSFSLFAEVFDAKTIHEATQASYHIGTGHRQFFPFDKYPNTTIVTDNAHHCLAGFCLFDKGVYVFRPAYESFMGKLVSTQRHTSSAAHRRKF